MQIMGICFILSLYTDSPFCQIWWLILPFNQPSEVQALDPPLHPNFKTFISLIYTYLVYHTYDIFVYYKFSFLCYFQHMPFHHVSQFWLHSFVFFAILLHKTQNILTICPKKTTCNVLKKINEHFFTLRLCICFAYNTWTLSLITRSLPPFPS